MSTLEQQVVDQLGSEGLPASLDRGAVLCDVEGLQIALWCDEVQRTIKAEASLCYPIDDFSPDLASALDFLNKNRAGVTYAYREQHRDLMATCSWSSPHRDPGHNQLHLLVGLLVQAFERDAGQLQGVAEGELSWEDLAQDPARKAEQLAPFGGRGRSNKSEQGTARWQSFMGDEDSPATGRRPRRGFERAPSTKAHRSQMPTRRLEDQQEDAPTRRLRAGNEETPVGGGISRNALQIAVAQADTVRPQGQVNYHQESIFARLIRFVFIVVLVGGIGTVLWIFFVQPFVPNDWKASFYSWFEAQVMEEQEILQRDRALMPAGKDLLLAELTAPLEDAAEHERNVQRSADALGDELVEFLEELLVTSSDNLSRGRAFALWDARGFGTPEGVMRLLRKLNETPVVRSGDDPVAGPLNDQIRNGTIRDDAVIAALEWAEGETFLACVERLGRENDENALDERAQALSSVLDKDTEDLDVLLALIRTGRGPADSALRLFEGRGSDWVRVQGRETILRYLSDGRMSIKSAFSSETPAVCLVAIELALDNRSEATLPLLSELLREHPLEEVRQAALSALPDLGPQAAWPLTEELGLPDVPDARRERAREALRSIPHDLAAQELRDHLAPDRSARERYLAVVGLTEIQGTPGVNVLIDVGLSDPDYRVRLKVLRALDELKDELKGSVRRGISSYRELALRDESQKVREVAAELYTFFSGREPR